MSELRGETELLHLLGGTSVKALGERGPAPPPVDLLHVIGSQCPRGVEHRGVPVTAKRPGELSGLGDNNEPTGGRLRHAQRKGVACALEADAATIRVGFDGGTVEQPHPSTIARQPARGRARITFVGFAPGS